jgi:hypothetical protein
MQSILYNKSFETDVKNIDLIISFFENYKKHLRKKEFIVYKQNISKLMDFMRYFEKNLVEERNKFNKEDSDNEDNYPVEYKNCDNEDSVSEYDTDTDDENTNNLRKKLVCKTSLTRNKYELVKTLMPVKFKKID